jgi:hypothetical protein
MRSNLAIRLAIAIGPLVLCCESASACVLWFCDYETKPIYAPMRAPPQDQRFGPVWTSNGWSYPDAQRHADAPFYRSHGMPRARDEIETIEPRLETPPELE